MWGTLEHNPRTGQVVAYHGSSPRMWGTLRIMATAGEWVRFIPTHVGNTGRAHPARSSRPVHPHACGEHLNMTWPLEKPTGSSPRMWGTRTPCRSFDAGVRFIPTHVGNTYPPPGRRARCTVHPHACGEHVRLGGSSPRMWGTRVLRRKARILVRFIPTHVGNTDHGIRGSAQPPVHPHACGEHVAQLLGIPERTGSSPRMWGTRDDGFLKVQEERFIPTHVGNTNALKARFIPTHVGNTRAPSRLVRFPAVHPHACGEHQHLGRIFC